MDSNGLLLVFCVIIIFNSGRGETNRKALVTAAIQEAKNTVMDISPHKTSTYSSSESLSAFKKASSDALQSGNTRILYEEMIKGAEKKILKNKRISVDIQDIETRAELLARELFHKPGSILTKDEIAKIKKESGCETILGETADCSKQEVTKFRTITGECNNLQNPLWGAAQVAFSRLLPAQYEDGLSQIRGTLQSKRTGLIVGGPFNPPVPSPRIISLSVIKDKQNQDNRSSHLLMQWGQFLNHDIVHAPAFQVDCMGCNSDERCASFHIPSDDPNFGMISSDKPICHAFPRSIPICTESHGSALTGARQQLNAVTSFIDGSQIYGSSNIVLNAVRQNNSGLLKTGPNIPSGGGPSLPFDTNGLVPCLTSPSSHQNRCFLAGDVRVNENVPLIIMHTIWMREHNRIADQLSLLNPHWENEVIFQVARKIVGAELQKITYQEYLPLILGDGYSLISEFKYNDKVSPNLPNAFASAAFRFGHSQVLPFFERLDENYKSLSIGPLNLMDSFFNPGQYSNSHGTDPILRGLLSRHAGKTDEFVSRILTKHLFQTKSSSRGMDLASLDIQRGRDHGLPPYMVWKRWAKRECGISSEIESELTRIRLVQLYGSLETVDLWVGGLAETPLSGGVVGATFACIIAKTFVIIRNGDRFYYENTDPMNGTFTSEQRAAIESTSLSRIICDNADNIKQIQQNAFLVNKSRVSCSSLPKIDLSAWKDMTQIQDDATNYKDTNSLLGNDIYEASLESKIASVMRTLDTLVKEKMESKAITTADNSNAYVDDVSSQGSQCYIKLLVTDEMPELVFQSLSIHPLSRTLSEADLPGTVLCLPFDCPRGTNNIRLIISPTQNEATCRVKSNPLLPTIEDSDGTYVGDISKGDIKSQAGLFRNLKQCMKYRWGNQRVGLKYTCGDNKVSTKTMIENLRLSNTSKGSSFMVDNDVYEASQESSLASPNKKESKAIATQNNFNVQVNHYSFRNCQCYIKLLINNQMPELEFQSVTVSSTDSRLVQESLPDTMLCLQFDCPRGNNNITLTVAPKSKNGTTTCTVMPNPLLPTLMVSGSMYMGNISNRDIKSRAGLFRNLNQCMKNSWGKQKFGLNYTCIDLSSELMDEQNDATKEPSSMFSKDIHEANRESKAASVMELLQEFVTEETKNKAVPTTSNFDVRLNGYLSQNRQCYIKLIINEQMSELEFQSVSVLLQLMTTTLFSADLPIGDTILCLQFECPKGNNNVILTVSPIENEARTTCTVMPNQLLPTTLIFGSSYTGNISVSDIRSPAGIFRNLNQCMKNSWSKQRFGLNYTCMADQTRRHVDGSKDQNPDTSRSTDENSESSESLSSVKDKSEHYNNKNNIMMVLMKQIEQLQDIIN